MNEWPWVTQQKKADFSTLCQLWHLKLSNKPDKEFSCQILDNSTAMILNCGHVSNTYVSVLKLCHILDSSTAMIPNWGHFSNTYVSVLKLLNAEGGISCWSEFIRPNGNSISRMGAHHFMAYENTTPCAFSCSDSCLKSKSLTEQ